MECSNITCAENTRTVLDVFDQSVPLCHRHVLEMITVLLENAGPSQAPIVTFSF